MMSSENITAALSRIRGKAVVLSEVLPVSGGDIHQAYHLKTRDGYFFLKVNQAGRLAMFESEKAGLEALRKGSIKVPKVYGLTTEGEHAFLLMEFVERGEETSEFWQRLGHGMARLHQLSGPCFGAFEDNFIGTLPQKNASVRDGYEFFILHRLMPQVKLAVDQSVISTAESKAFDAFFKQIRQLIPDQPAVLLHGDLWSGNKMPALDNQPVIFDPAVYYGWAEQDLAMTRLFGGFSPTFYQVYQEEMSMPAGWEQRMDYYNLYPLMVHVNLFGRSYWKQVSSILRSF
ncbi:fructosamine kinase family protein [Persicobacter sp. CCB-QB2]|uniref:fructosamine kinase family protein n=1 Tax=Persicobacter sp. CCB-QB2 TaxID=1561025 RepID=UPI0006A961D5|nr:fructosamine kinase family protein [Persicobacter sp. CCB-QB2]